MPFRIESRDIDLLERRLTPWEEVCDDAFATRREAEEAMDDLVDIGFDPDRLRVVEVEA
jgi:hypothetical protein